MRRPLLLILTLNASSACSSVDERFDSTAEPIAAEQGNGIAEAMWHRYTLDAVANRVSFAVADIGGCSATLVGPDILMTAAHCGNVDLIGKVTTYPGLSGIARDDLFDCKLLINTWPDSDVVLHRCTSPATGGGPGVYYGYVDLDPSEPQVGEDLFTLWRNPIVSLGVDSAVIFSTGQVVSTNVKLWGDGPRLSNQPVAIYTTTWTNPGASGSAQVNAATGRLLIGPTSTGAIDGPGRNALSIKTYMEQAMVFGRTQSGVGGAGVHVETLTAMGLNPDDYLGSVDKNHNYLFDVAEDIERTNGEWWGFWHHVGFESARANRLWDFDPHSVRIDALQEEAYFRVATDSHVDVLANRRLKILPGFTYRIGMRVQIGTMTPGACLHVVLRSAGLETEAVVPVVALGVYQDVAVRITAPHTNQRAELIIRGSAGTASSVITGALRDIVVVTESPFPSSNSFDEHRMRMSWIDAATLRPALVIPVEGPTDTGLNGNWAGFVLRRSSRSATDDWPLSTREFALVADAAAPGHSGVWYSACFDVRRASTQSYARGRARFVDGASSVDVTFTPSATPTRVCTGPFQPRSAGAMLQFGFADDASAGAYFVDNVVVDTVPCIPTATCESDSCGAIDDGCGGTMPCGGCGRGARCVHGLCSGACCTGGCGLGRTCNAKTCTCSAVPQ